MCCCEGRQCLWQARLLRLCGAVRWVWWDCSLVMLGSSCVAVFAPGHRGLPGASPVLVGAVALRIGALPLWVGLGPCLASLA